MFHLRQRTALISLGAVLLMGIGVAFAQQLKAPPTSVAAVDLQEVFDKAKLREVIRAEQQKRGEQLQAEQKDRQQKLAAMEQDLKVMKVGTPEYAKMQDDMAMKALEYNNWLQFENAKLMRDQGVNLEKLYRYTLESIEKIAQERGIDIVVYKETAPNFQWENPQQLSAQIQIRKVLYAADSVDITNDVIQRLNNEHAAN